jgi:hypothetical protein
MAKSKDWIKAALGGASEPHRGSLRKTAEHAHMISGDHPLTSADLTKLAHSKNPKTRKRANLAKTLEKFH